MDHISGRSLVAWMRIKTWCILNPKRLAVIYTPNGRYELKFIPEGDQNEIPEASATE